MHACQISLAYLSAFKRKYSFRDPFYEEYESEYDHLLELAQDAGNTRTLLHLRAFLCIELAVREALGGLDSANYLVSPGLTWDRSWAGLTQLVEALRDDHISLLAYEAEYALQQSNLTTAQATLTRRILLRQVLLPILVSALRLRRSLSNHNTKLKSIGSMAMLSLYHRASGPKRILDIAFIILSCTEENVKRAWEMDL